MSINLASLNRQHVEKYRNNAWQKKLSSNCATESFVDRRELLFLDLSRIVVHGYRKPFRTLIRFNQARAGPDSRARMADGYNKKFLCAARSIRRRTRICMRRTARSSNQSPWRCDTIKICSDSRRNTFVRRLRGTITGPDARYLPFHRVI